MNWPTAAAVIFFLLMCVKLLLLSLTPLLRYDTHTHTRARTLNYTLTYAHAHTLNYTLRYAHAHTLNYTLTYAHTHTLKPTAILRALTCLDKGPETGRFSCVLGVVGIISIFMY